MIVGHTVEMLDYLRSRVVGTIHVCRHLSTIPDQLDSGSADAGVHLELHLANVVDDFVDFDIEVITESEAVCDTVESLNRANLRYLITVFDTDVGKRDDSDGQEYLTEYKSSYNKVEQLWYSQQHAAEQGIDE